MGRKGLKIGPLKVGPLGVRFSPVATLLVPNKRRKRSKLF